MATVKGVTPARVVRSAPANYSRVEAAVRAQTGSGALKFFRSFGLRVLTAGSVAGNVATTFPVSAVESYRVVSVAFRLVASAVVASRAVRVEGLADSFTLWGSAWNAAHTAGQDVRYRFVAGGRPLVDVVLVREVPLGDVWLPVLGVLQIRLDSGDAGDVVSEARALVECWGGL